MPLLRFCRPAREAWDRACNRCADYYPCLSDPVRRSSLSVKLALVTLHLVFVGVLFLFDSSLVEILKTGTWYVVVYLVLFVATIAQYFFTSGSSPGYVLDAIRVVNDSHVIFQKPPTIQKQSAPGKNRNVIISVEGTQSGRNVLGSNSTPWTKLVMDMYPPDSSIRTWTCSYCHVLQPPRAKHCHDCDKCVLQFDHHCVWLGTCIGQGNHCRFWWYIFEETALSIWTCALYISFLKDNFERAWWKDGFSILLLAILSIALLFLLLLLIFHSYLILTNQTTYELVRRRRIPYLRGIPERVYPFSQGICRNVYNFCCIRNSQYKLEALPSVQELDARARPYTCCDVLSCRCC